MKEIDKNGSELGSDTVIEKKVHKKLPLLSTIIESLSPVEGRIEPWEFREFGHTGALLVSIALWKTRNNNGLSFDLSMNELKDDFHIGRSKQDTAIQELTNIGVFTRVTGGKCNVRRFSFDQEIYNKSKARADGHPEDLGTFANKFDDNEMSKYERNALLEKSKLLAEECLSYIDKFDNSSTRFLEIMKAIDGIDAVLSVVDEIP